MSYFFIVMTVAGLVSSSMDKAVGPYEPFSVTYELPESTDELHYDRALFLGGLEEKEPYMPFAVSSVKATLSTDKKKRTYTFSLLPKRPGSLIFFPGVLTSSSAEDIVFEPIPIQVLRPIALLSMAEPLLPVNADQRIALSDKNKKRAFYEDLEVEKLREAGLFASRENFIAIISMLIIGIVGAVLLLWIGYEYERGHERVRKLPDPVDWEKELARLIQGGLSKLTIEARFDAAAAILAHIPLAPPPAHELLSEVRFSGRPPVEADWSRFMNHMVEYNRGKRDSNEL